MINIFAWTKCVLMNTVNESFHSLTSQMDLVMQSQTAMNDNENVGCSRKIQNSLVLKYPQSVLNNTLNNNKVSETALGIKNVVKF